MKSRKELQIYKKNQRKLIKALISKNRENKELKKAFTYLYALNRVYETFLTTKQKTASETIAMELVKNKEGDVNMTPHELIIMLSEKLGPC